MITSGTEASAKYADEEARAGCALPRLSGEACVRPLAAPADSLQGLSFAAIPTGHRPAWGGPARSRRTTSRQHRRTGTLELLEIAGNSDDALYFYSLCLFHEDMHAEALVCVAQTLGLKLDAPTLQAFTPAPITFSARYLA